MAVGRGARASARFSVRESVARPGLDTSVRSQGEAAFMPRSTANWWTPGAPNTGNSSCQSTLQAGEYPGFRLLTRRVTSTACAWPSLPSGVGGVGTVEESLKP